MKVKNEVEIYVTIYTEVNIQKKKKITYLLPPDIALI